MTKLCRFCEDGLHNDCLDGTTNEETMQLVECYCPEYNHMKGEASDEQFKADNPNRYFM